MIQTSCGRSRPRNRRKGQVNKRIQKTPEPYLTGEVLTIMQRMQPSNSGYASEAPSLGPWARSQRWRPAWTASILDCVFYLFMPAKWTSSGLGGLQAIHAARKSRRWEQSEAWAHERLLVQWKNFLKRSKINWKRKSNQWSNQSSNQTINPKII